MEVSTRETLFVVLGAALSAAGVFVAGTLWWAHRRAVSLPCTGDGHGCDIVNASRWAHVSLGAGRDIPLALLGLTAYVVLLTLHLALLGSETGAMRRGLRLGIRLLAAGGLCYSWYLQYVAHVLIGAFCVWCFASACLMTGVAVCAFRPVRFQETSE